MENDVRNGQYCSLCSKKISFMEKNYIHILSDGTACQKCHLTIQQLLSQKKYWVSKEEYSEVMKKDFNPRAEYAMPLEKAQDLFLLRDRVCSGFLQTVGLQDGGAFTVQNVFAMPKSPPIFILRAMKLKNKAVLQGFPLKGEVRKGDRIKIALSGMVCEFTALDVVPAGTDPLTKETFYSQLGANVHNHKVDEERDGWIIIDTEDCQSLSNVRFAAVCNRDGLL